MIDLTEEEPPVDARFAEIDDLLWRFTDIWLDGTGQVTVRDRALVETRRLFAAGVAEGRRQATEERTEEAVRIDVSLDSPAYRRQLQKMIRTGQIVLPDADHG